MIACRFALVVLAILSLMAAGSVQSAVNLIEIETLYAHGFVGTGNGNSGRLSEFVSGAVGGTGIDEGLTKVDANDIGTWTHGQNWQQGWQAANLSGGTNLGWVMSDFGESVTDLGSMYLWNVKEQGSGPQSRGVQTFNIWYRDTVISAPGQTNYNFSANGWTQLGSSTFTLESGGAGTSTGTEKLFDGSYDLSSIDSARYIAIEIISNYGSNSSGSPDGTINRSGLAEIVFTAVPEPGKAALILIGIIGATLRRRR